MLACRFLSFLETCTCYCWKTVKISYASYSEHTVSKLFLPQTIAPKNIETKKEDALCISHRLMLDQGVIQHASVGSFHLLPLGMRALRKLVNIVDREMESVGAQKIKMPFLTPGDLWKKTGRWDTTGLELLKLQDRHHRDYVLSPTHEEAVTELVASLPQFSYRSLPLRLYQMTSKFRDEMKPRLGLLRSREFLMKDLYTFDATLESARQAYDAVCKAYDAIFSTLGIQYVKVEGDVGLMGGSVSHEYHYLTDIGEDKLLFCPECHYGANLQVCGDSRSSRCPRCSHDHMSTLSGIEVGHTFLLGTKYSLPLNAHFLGADGKPATLQMGCYGIGLTRLLAAAVECLSLPEQLRWPLAIAPFSVCILPPKDGSKESVASHMSPSLYSTLNSIKVLSNDVLIDDRCHLTIGRRLFDAKKTGYPLIVVIGKKAVLNEPLLEVHDLLQDVTFDLSQAKAVQYIADRTSTLTVP